MVGRRSWIFGIAVAGALTFGLACGNDGDVDETNGGLGLVTPTPASEAEGGGIQPPAGDEDRNDFIRSAEERYNRLEDRAGELEGDVNLMPEGDERDAAEERLQQLRGELSDVGSKINEARTSSDDDFEELRDDIDNSLGDAEDRIGELADRLGL